MKYQDNIVCVINGYSFNVNFVPKSELENFEGITMHNNRVIKIRDDLDKVATTLILRHEIVHALLGTQGRVFQTRFSCEELCEFVAYNLPTIEQITDYILSMRYMK